VVAEFIRLERLVWFNVIKLISSNMFPGATPSFKVRSFFCASKNGLQVWRIPTREKG
jgi:hypothetical protein